MELTEILDRLERRIGNSRDTAEMPVEVSELKAMIAGARRALAEAKAPSPPRQEVRGKGQTPR